MNQTEQVQARADAFAERAMGFILPTSTASNYRAARRARSRDECVAKLGMVSEDIEESVCRLQRAMTAAIDSSPVDLAALLAEAKQLARIFAASHRTAKKRQRR